MKLNNSKLLTNHKYYLTKYHLSLLIITYFPLLITIFLILAFTINEINTILIEFNKVDKKFLITEMNTVNWDICTWY